VTVGALILAAGFSRRYGGPKLNAILPSGKTVFAQTHARLVAAIPEVHVVTRPELVSCILPHSKNIHVFENSELGMGASLAYGVARLPTHWDACLVCLGDMPYIATDTYHTIADRADTEHIVVPFHAGKPGNPVAFGRKFFEELSQLSGDNGGRIIVNKNPLAVIELTADDSAILFDIDTPADLSAAPES